MTETHLEELDAGDVVVIGAGASGVLTSSALSAKGLEVTLIDRRGLAAEQSSHSHGYMHRGHIYQKPSPELVLALQTGADRWKDELTAVGVKPLNENAVVGFIHEHNAKVAAGAWREAGLQFGKAEAVPGVNHDALPFCYDTREQTYDFTAWFEAARSRHLGNVRTVQATATGLLRDDREIVGVRVDIGERTLVLRSRFVVLAAGTGNLDLVSTATTYRGRAMNRLSFMLVLAARGLPRLSLVSPENGTYGLFMVSRHTDEMDYWLVSNFVSYSDVSCTRNAAALWIRGVVRLMNMYTFALNDNYSPEWAIYPAAKGELRSNRNQIEKHTTENYRLNNVCVAAPTKLTLAPLLADDIAAHVLKHIMKAPPRASRPPVQGQSLDLVPETWTAQTLLLNGALHHLNADPMAGAECIQHPQIRQGF
ncbi:FAD-dependent oxidoreductase [Mycolicibacterium fortuitum]|uniref:FAD-dependent oxidoreductase n=1 Tax=Mycolicibacterium fortuitum TaxID=1766 RepID=UPI001A7EE551|nr:FAD-binding oxidoreductase [Mycolicibacterium fortuitum]MDV7202481.1 FAD-binding oxidoreductase [Mycolicibacterium fortuitum]MDV7329851.1 FAD-binding oxidoreductase [Mycolicibacterium fortuitum]